MPKLIWKSEVNKNNQSFKKHLGEYLQVKGENIGHIRPRYCDYKNKITGYYWWVTIDRIQTLSARLMPTIEASKIDCESLVRQQLDLLKKEKNNF